VLQSTKTITLEFDECTVVTEVHGPHGKPRTTRRACVADERGE
jgi:hypothetical protein